MRRATCVLGLIGGLVFGGDVRGEIFEEGSPQFTQLTATGCYVEYTSTNPATGAPEFDFCRCRAGTTQTYTLSPNGRRQYLVGLTPSIRCTFTRGASAAEKADAAAQIQGIDRLVNDLNAKNTAINNTPCNPGDVACANAHANEVNRNISIINQYMGMRSAYVSMVAAPLAPTNFPAAPPPPPTREPEPAVVPMDQGVLGVMPGTTR